MRRGAAHVALRCAMSDGPEGLVPAPLRYFLAIAEEGSFTGGARSIGMSQPALTAAIQELERDLDTTLFVRTARGVTLTRTGETLVGHARGLVRAAGELRSAIHDLEHEPRGRFTLGCHESLGAYFLPGFLTRFFEAQPRIEVALWNGNSRDVHAAVVERRIDVGIVVNPSPHPDVVIVPLFARRPRARRSPNAPRCAWRRSGSRARPRSSPRPPRLRSS